MKRSTTPLQATARLSRQMNLWPLHSPATIAAFGGQQKELTLALVELLIHAAQRDLEAQANGGENESPEAHA